MSPLPERWVGRHSSTHSAPPSSQNGKPQLKRARIVSPVCAAKSRPPATTQATLDLDLLGCVATAAARQLSTAAGNLLQALQPVRAVPAPSGQWIYPPGPSVDVTLPLLADPLRLLSEIAQAYGPISTLQLAGSRIVLLAEPEAVQQVLVSNAACYTKAGTAFFPGSSLVGNGLLVSDGAVWQRQRQLSNPAFRKQAVESYTQAMEDATLNMLQTAWRPGQQLDVYEAFNRLTLQITTTALFGDDMTGSGYASNLTGAINTAFEHFASRSLWSFIPEWVPLPMNLQFHAAVACLDRAVFALIRQRRTQAAVGQPQHWDLLGALLAAQDEQGNGFLDTDLRDQLMTLLIAGQETSAIVLSWAAACLAHAPVVQSRAADEVQGVLGNRTLASTGLSELPYLTAVVLEAMRLHPPAYMIGRCAATAVTLGSYAVPPGTSVFVSPYLLHRLPDVWLEPSQFRPERWLPQLAKPGGLQAILSGQACMGSYLPFGAGPRNCIGTGFAMAEAVLVLAAVLQRYELSPTQPSMPKPEPRITLRPSPVVLRLAHRRAAPQRAASVAETATSQAGAEAQPPALVLQLASSVR